MKYDALVLSPRFGWVFQRVQNMSDVKGCFHVFALLGRRQEKQQSAHSGGMAFCLLF